MSIESYDNIVHFPNERLEAKSDKDVYELFIAQVSHPSFGHTTGDKLAERIIDLGGKETSASTDDGQQFRKRIHAIRAGSVLPSDTLRDEAMDDQSDRYDEAFVAIVQARIATQHTESLRLREALFVLFDMCNAGSSFDLDNTMKDRVTITLLQLVKRLTADLADD